MPSSRPSRRTPSTVTQLLQRLATGRADQCGLLGAARSSGAFTSNAPACRTISADPVRDHVVHLPGDAGPLLGLGLLGVGSCSRSRRSAWSRRLANSGPAGSRPTGRARTGTPTTSSATTTANRTLTLRDRPAIRADTTRTSAPTSTPEPAGAPGPHRDRVAGRPSGPRERRISGPERPCRARAVGRDGPAGPATSIASPIPSTNRSAGGASPMSRNRSYRSRWSAVRTSTATASPRSTATRPPAQRPSKSADRPHSRIHRGYDPLSSHPSDHRPPDLRLSSGIAVDLAPMPPRGTAGHPGPRTRRDGKGVDRGDGDHGAGGRQSAVVSAVGVAKVYGEGEASVAALDGVDRRRSPRGSSPRSWARPGRASRRCCTAWPGWTRSTSGRVFIGGADLTALRRQRSSPGCAGTASASCSRPSTWCPTLTARENITLPMDMAGREPDRGLARHGGRRGRPARPAARTARPSSPAASSSGWPCARALVSGPQVVFADEPTGNLDSRSGAEVLGVPAPRRSTSSARPIVMVTHDPTAAALRRPGAVPGRRPAGRRPGPADRRPGPGADEAPRQEGGLRCVASRSAAWPRTRRGSP